MIIDPLGHYDTSKKLIKNETICKKRLTRFIK